MEGGREIGDAIVISDGRGGGAGIRPGRKVTIAEVARHAGVSIGTVSNTLNHPDRVIAPTRDAVWASIETLGYVPSQAARLLSGAQSQTLGLVIPDVESPFFMALSHSVERAATASGYSLLLCNSQNDASREPLLLQTLASHQAHGALVSPAGDSRAPTINPPLPVVYLDHEGPEGACAVLVDHVTGGRLAAEHLLSLGHTRLAFIGGRPWLWQFEQRVRGIREALRDAGKDPTADLMLVESPGIGVESGMMSARQLVKRGLPSGVLCGNDMLAFGVFRGLAAARVRVPQDVSLIGYDNILFAEHWVRPLTTVAQPMERMGELAGQVLIEHAAGGPGHSCHSVTLTPTLVVRESTGPAPRVTPPAGAHRL